MIFLALPSLFSAHPPFGPSNIVNDSQFSGFWFFSTHFEKLKRREKRFKFKLKMPFLLSILHKYQSAKKTWKSTSIALEEGICLFKSSSVTALQKIVLSRILIRWIHIHMTYVLCTLYIRHLRKLLIPFSCQVNTCINKRFLHFVRPSVTPVASYTI